MVGRTETTINGRKEKARAPRKAKQADAAKPTFAERLRQAEAERDEARAQQAATAEILQIINRSSGDATPVFQAIVERAMRLCNAPFGGLLVPDGEYLRYLALGNAPPRFAAFLTHERIRLGTMLGPGVLAGETLHIVDLLKEDSYRRRVPVTVSAVEDGGIRSLICVPLIKDGAFIGAFTLYRQEVRPFTDRQIALARSFADQAAIAMENARLLTETREALEHQTATSDVLKVINASPGELAPVFEAMLDKALRLCDASLGALYLHDGGVLRMAAQSGASPEAVEALRVVVPEPGTGTAQILVGADVVQVADAADTDAYRSGIESRRKFVDLTGGRSAIWVALRKDDALLGILIVYRREVGKFSDKHVALLQNFAAQAVIAIENARLIDETREALEKQTATAEILHVISSSPTDLQPTLDAIAARATLLSDGANGHVFTYDGTLIHHRAQYGGTEAGRAAIRAVFPVAPSRGSSICRAIMTREISHIVDPKLDPEFAHVELTEYGTALSVPMLRDGKALGGIAVIRQRVEPFTPAQIDLLKTFADQAVIAIENVRLFTELRQRTGDLQESLEYQTATSDVLKVISRSTFDLQLVLDTLVETAGRLCNSGQAALTIRDGEVYRYKAANGVRGEFWSAITQRAIVPGRDSVAGRVALEGKIVQIADITVDPDYALSETITHSTLRTILGMPLLREGIVVGTLQVGRDRVEPFTERQIELVRTFADQAVIAIENARLLTELRESLDRQTAMSEILAVISATPGQVQPVFEKVLECALRLSRAHMGTISRVVDGIFTEAARIGAPSEFSFKLDNYSPPPDTPLGRMLAAKSTIRIDDYRATEGYAQRNPAIVSLVEQGRGRSAMQVPLLKDDMVVGAMTIYRPEARPLGDQEATLAEDFAKQAVIAIENARLLTELRESLEQQQAIAEVLQVINASPGNLQPVFDAILDKAHSLCGANIGWLMTFDGELVRMGASRGLVNLDPSVASAPFLPGPAMRRLIDGESFFQIPDISEAKDMPGTPLIWRASCELLGTGNYLVVPLRKDGAVHGFINAFRSPIQIFSEKEIALLQSFAAQAVIAMDNARLLTELRESLEQQQAIAEVLQVINASPGNLTPVFDAILEKAHTLCSANRGALFLLDDERFRAAAVRGYPDAVAKRLRQGDRVSKVSPAASLLEGARLVHNPDLLQTLHTDDVVARTVVEQGGVRTNLLLPLRKDNALLGFISCNRSEVRPFADKEIALLESFAAQAVIAMDNARLLNELRERTNDLQQSLEYQTATSDVLKVISRSTFDLDPVLQYVLDTAMRLCHAVQGSIFRLDGTHYHWAVGQGLDPVYEEIERNTPIAPGEGTVVGRAALHCQTVQIVDAWEDPLYAPKDDARITVARTMLGVPLLREGLPIGVIAMARKVVEPFTDKEIELVTTFADQAVIAIENARLLNELQSRQAELRVTFDNMGDAVIMFDGQQRLVAWNRNFLHMLDIPEEWLATPRGYAEYAAYLTERGEFGDTPPPDLGAPERGEVQPIRYERTRPDGRILEVRRNPIPGGAGFVFIYADITERKLAEQSILAAREAAERALGDLKLAQANLVQSEKMASLGQLTAGIAHEIKNPLNFVNNFANLSNELLGELKEAAAPAFATLGEDKREEIDETLAMLTGNLEKIQEHGKRADGIVKSMLAHSRGGSGDRRAADVNALVEESLNLAYHGARAQDQNFNITLERDYDKAMKPIELVPQDVTRVFLNLCGNGFYAANKRRKEGGDADFRPVLKVATRELGDAVEVRIRDNGTGIPPEIKAKLFQPFFTTKPTGEGTGLGLSISYDIVTQQHGGTIAIDSQVGAFTEFTIHLPRKR